MWDFDQQGIVVNVHFPANANLDMYSTKTSSKIIIYELESFGTAFYNIRMHEISALLKYRTVEYLIPVGMAYLQRAGTMEQYSNITYYQYAGLKYLKREDVLMQAFYETYGHYSDGTLADTQKSDEIDAQITEKTITLEELKHAKQQ